jgi:hypothetical protein
MGTRCILYAAPYGARQIRDRLCYRCVAPNGAFNPTGLPFSKRGRWVLARSRRGGALSQRFETRTVRFEPLTLLRDC